MGTPFTLKNSRLPGRRKKPLGSGMQMADIATPGERAISTHAMGEAVAAWVCQSAGQTQRSLRAEE